MSDNFNNNYMEDVFWDGLFEMAENYEEQEESPIYENINFYDHSNLFSVGGSYFRLRFFK